LSLRSRRPPGFSTTTAVTHPNDTNPSRALDSGVHLSSPLGPNLRAVAADVDAFRNAADPVERVCLAGNEGEGLVRVRSVVGIALVASLLPGAAAAAQEPNQVTGLAA
jgi:hypothetical protein